MLRSHLVLSVALGGLVLVGCKQEDKGNPSTQPKAPATLPALPPPAMPTPAEPAPGDMTTTPPTSLPTLPALPPLPPTTAPSVELPDHSSAVPVLPGLPAIPPATHPTTHPAGDGAGGTDSLNK